MFERFTRGAREAVVLAQEAARQRGDDHIGAGHLLVGVARSRGQAARALQRRGVTPESAARAALGVVPGGPPGSEGRMMPFTPEAKKALELALREAMGSGSRDIRVRHLLIALTRLERLAPAFAALEVDRAALRQELQAAIAPPPEFGPAVGPLTVQVGEHPLGDLGNPRVDANVLLALVRRGGPVAVWLAGRGVDEAAIRERFGGL